MLRSRFRNGPRLEQLEDRILMSSVPLVAPLEADRPSVEGHVYFAPLSASEGDGGGGKGAGGPEGTDPIFLGFPTVILGEDSNNYSVNLGASFRPSPDNPSVLRYSLLNQVPSLFEQVSIVGEQLVLNLAQNAYGEALIPIRCTDDLGEFVDGVLRVTILAANDRPTTTGIPSIVLQGGTSKFQIDLFSVFDDVEDRDDQLTYSVSSLSNPAMFRAIEVNPATGTISFFVAPGEVGTCLITLRATDREGAYVEMSTRGRDFPVYDMIQWTWPDKSALSLRNINLVTDFALFDEINGVYQYDHFNIERLRSYLNSSFFDPDAPVVFDIENDIYVNTPDGRERFAEVIRAFRQEVPDSGLAGFYGYFPDTNWWDTIPWLQAQQDASQGRQTWYTLQADEFRQRYMDMLARSEPARSEPLRDGSVLADYITLYGPTLYTSYRNGYSTTADPMAFQVQFSGVTDRFTVSDTVFANGTELRFSLQPGLQLPTGFQPYVSYYVVNASNHTFQLSSTPGGAPLDLAGNQTGNRYMEVWGPRNHYLHDPEVLHWQWYAQTAIDESRKFPHDAVIPWLSPSFRGLGSQYLDENFFRVQLDYLYEHAEGIALYNPPTPSVTDPANQGWFRALSSFMDYLSHPTQFEVEILAVPDQHRSSSIIRMDRFTGPGFASGFARMDEVSQGSNRGSLDGGISGIQAPLNQVLSSVGVSLNSNFVTPWIWKFSHPGHRAADLATWESPRSGGSTANHEFGEAWSPWLGDYGSQGSFRSSALGNPSADKESWVEWGFPKIPKMPV